MENVPSGMRGQPLADEVAALQADDTDRREMRDVATLMATLRTESDIDQRRRE